MLVHRRHRLSTVATACLLALLLFGCVSKVNQENFDRIQVGMTRAQVQAILGRPSQASAVQFGNFSGTAAAWKRRDGTTISIQFLDGKVQAKQFYSGPR